MADVYRSEESSEFEGPVHTGVELTTEGVAFMRRISLIVFSLGLMLAGAVPFARAETPATQDSVQLTFAWPEDLRGQVTYFV